MPPGNARMILKGIGVSPGVAIGKAYRVDRDRVSLVYYYLPSPAQTEKEKKRFDAAVDKTEADLKEIKSKIAGEFPEHSFILDTQTKLSAL
jgi:phosphotransferase system enzyme I (PtsI)